MTSIFTKTDKQINPITQQIKIVTFKQYFNERRTQITINFNKKRSISYTKRILKKKGEETHTHTQTKQNNKFRAKKQELSKQKCYKRAEIVSQRDRDKERKRKRNKEKNIFKN